MTTRVAVDVLYELEIDVPCDQLAEFELMARLATGIVRRGHVPVLVHPQTGEPVEAKVLYYGEAMPGCPVVGWRGERETEEVSV